MNQQNSSLSSQTRPEDLMEELGVKKATYYADLKHLGIKASKDENGNAYLTNDEADLVRQLRSHVSQTGKREGFNPEDTQGDLVHQESQEITTLSNQEDSDLDLPGTEDLEGELEGNSLEQLIHEAAALKLKNLVAPDLIKLHLAEQMSEEDLPPEMRDRVQAVREAANPKFQPATIASKLLGQWRSRRGNS